MPLTYSERFDMNMLQAQQPHSEVIAIRLAPSSTYACGAVLMETGTPGVYANYDDSAAPKGLLKRACVTDANGNISFGAQGGGGEFGQVYPSNDMYVSGIFSSADIQQAGAGEILAVAVTPGNAHQFARLLQGTIAAGLIKLL